MGKHNKEKTKISKDELIDLLMLETAVAKYKMGLNFRWAFYNFLTEQGFKREEALKLAAHIWEKA